MFLRQLLILLFLLMIYSKTGHLYQRASWNYPDCSLPMVLHNRSCMLFLHLKRFKQTLYNLRSIYHPLRCFTILFSMTNIGFLFFLPLFCHFCDHPLWLFFVSLFNDRNSNSTFLLAFLDISSSYLFFWLSSSLLQKHPGVFLFRPSLFSMVFVFCSCL